MINSARCCLLFRQCLRAVKSTLNVLYANTRVRTWEIATQVGFCTFCQCLLFSHKNARSAPKKSLKCSDNACHTETFFINRNVLTECYRYSNSTHSSNNKNYFSLRFRTLNFKFFLVCLFFSEENFFQEQLTFIFVFFEKKKKKREKYHKMLE